MSGSTKVVLSPVSLLLPSFGLVDEDPPPIPNNPNDDEDAVFLAPRRRRECEGGRSTEGVSDVFLSYTVYVILG